MKRVGCFVGKFLPPHIGHLSIMDMALKECDEVIVVLSEDPARSKVKCESVGFPYFDSNTRLSWLKQHYKDNENIKFYFLDESGLKSFPEGLKEWSARFREVVKDKINVKYADESYRQLNEKYFPDCEFVPINRDLIPIHGTDIREKEECLKYVVEEGYQQIKSKLEENNHE